MKTSWTHGDKPTATLLNEYRTALIEAHAALGDLSGWSAASDNVYAAEETWPVVFVLLHTWRYLHFVSSGKIMELDGSNERDINEDDETGQGRLDLDTLDWLVYGQLYRVTGVTICMEDWSA